MEKVRVGVIGIGARGVVLLHAMLACEECEVTAVCEVYDDRLQNGVDIVKEKRNVTPKAYKNYKELIDDENVDAVVITASWEEHVPMAVYSMKAKKYTAVEVGGAYDLEDCWQLVRTYEETGTPIMMLENCCFDKFELLSTSLARAGKLGRVVYCHGAYAHELRGDLLGSYKNRHYRLTDYRYRNCENYPTHELGPIAKLLNINRGNKMLMLSSVATKGGIALEEAARSPQSPDPSLVNVPMAQGDIVVTTITCTNGEVITLRLDTTLPRHYSREFTVRGTKGLCMQETNMVLLEGTDNMHEFFEPALTAEKHLNNAEKYKEYLPKIWRDITPEEKELGHGGMDYLEFKAFFDAILNGKEMPIDVYDVASWMCITPLSEQSIAQGGAPQAIPDFTRGRWMRRPSKDVTELPVVKEEEVKEEKAFGHARRLGE
ncbi:MAG: Gfo/Idh/MocA family oxidoreductase [Clostridia bacterium]|nr:Gfo/Idh/MocA family oxidoreductase [Clostridia bacterium]